MLENKKAVIFDMDGTLMDSMWMWHDIDIEYLGKFGLNVPDDLEVAVEGMGFTETAVYFKERFGIPSSIEEIKEEWQQMAYDKYAHHVFFKPGAGRLIRELKDRGVLLGIATSNHIGLVNAALASNGAEGMFDCIRTSCDVAHGKPAPDVYLAVADALGVAPEDCLVFEDVPMGALAGLNAGMTVCGVEDADAADRTEELKKVAQYYVHDFNEVLDGTYEELR